VSIRDVAPIENSCSRDATANPSSPNAALHVTLRVSEPTPAYGGVTGVPVESCPLSITPAIDSERRWMAPVLRGTL